MQFVLPAPAPSISAPEPDRIRDPPSPALLAAAAMIDRLWEAMQSLRDLPFRYPVVSAKRQPRHAVRRMPVGMYFVYYRVAEEQAAVRVITVRHGARRQPRRFD